jgi:voltage-gated potassium channel
MPKPGQVGPKTLVSALERKPLTARRAALIIASFTLVVTLAGGLVAWLTGRDDFSSLGASMWWALQTVTTVGYGDVVPRSTGGRLIGAAVMLTGIGFLTVLTGSVTAALVEAARKRSGGMSQRELAAHLQEISARLSAIEAGLRSSQEPPTRPPG